MTDLFKEKSHTFSEITRLAQRLEGGAVKQDTQETENGNGDVGGTLIEVSTLGEEEFEGEEVVARMQMLGAEFKEHCHKAWSQLMALETHLYEQIEDTISTFERNLSELVASFIESAQCLENKDALQNMLVSSHDSHLQAIDGREDILMSEARSWLREKCDKYIKEEVEANRKRLHEIITVTNLLVEELEELQASSITLPMLAEMEIMEG